MVRRAAVVPYSAVFPMLWVTEDASSVTGRIGQSAGRPTTRPDSAPWAGPGRRAPAAPAGRAWFRAVSFVALSATSVHCGTATWEQQPRRWLLVPASARCSARPVEAGAVLH